MKPGVTVVIPTIPIRPQLLQRAVQSVHDQQLPAEDIVIEVDRGRRGAGPTRTAGLRRVETEWTAFLDDDDIMYPHHLSTLVGLAEETGASILWGWFDGNQVWANECPSLCPNDCHRHKDFEFSRPHLFGITYLVRTELAQQCEFGEPDPNSWCSNEDYGFLLQLMELTDESDWAHTPEITWHYYCARDHRNTSGHPANWR